jgi:hypothetical protein
VRELTSVFLRADSTVPKALSVLTPRSTSRAFRPSKSEPRRVLRQAFHPPKLALIFRCHLESKSTVTAETPDRNSPGILAAELGNIEKAPILRAQFTGGRSADVVSAPPLSTSWRIPALAGIGVKALLSTERRPDSLPPVDACSEPQRLGERNSGDGCLSRRPITVTNRRQTRQGEELDNKAFSDNNFRLFSVLTIAGFELTDLPMSSHVRRSERSLDRAVTLRTMPLPSRSNPRLSLPSECVRRATMAPLAEQFRIRGRLNSYGRALLCRGNR